VTTHLNRVVLVYSGGPDASAAISLLKARYDAEVITVTLDLGQGNALESVRDRALSDGAQRAHVLDVREQFAGEFILPALKADAISEGGQSLAGALAHTVIARTLVEIARIEQARAVAHEFCRSVVDQARLETAIRALDPALKIIALDLPCEMAGAERPDSGRDVQKPEPTGEPASVAISFERGVPVAINGVNMSLLDLIGSLETISGGDGINPSVLILHAAHRNLQKLVVARELDGFATIVARQYADLIDDGLWFTPLREALDGFIDRVQERVTGVVRLQLLKGGCRIVGRQSPFALDSRPQEEVGFIA